MRLLIRCLILLFLAALGFAAYSFFVWRAPYVPVAATVMIAPGTGAREVLAQLHEQGAAPAPWKILLPFALSGDAARLKAGEYAFEADLSAEQVLSRMAEGKVVVHSLTIPEGFSVAQVKALLLAEPLLTGDLPPIIAEGSLFPDTVHFSRGEAREKVVGRLQAQMQEVLAAAWQEKEEGLPLANPQEALVLASIVEEETGVADERGRVAAVYINRLRLGMRLQADPTVAYGVAPEGMDRALTTRDLQKDTPYNTYTRTGLPPTPICNPGEASLKAVLHPPKTDEYYFVATGTGGHYFARNAKEHQANVVRYRKELKSKQSSNER